MYGKLFVQMYDGTLATKGPWQALVTFQQLLILADKHGIIDMTIEAIARRTTIPLEIIQNGIQKLLEPDDQSRSPAEEGKRIVPLSDNRNWGWKVVNYEHYRAIRSEDERREYHKQYMRNRRAVNQNVKVSTPSDQCQPIAVSRKQEADSKALKSKPLARRPDGFVRFYAAYPNKKNPKDALKAWDSLKPSAELVDIMVAAVARAVTSVDWLKEGGKYIPHPARWIRAGAWENEIQIQNAKQAAKQTPCKTCGQESTDWWIGNRYCSQHIREARDHV